MMMKLSFEDIGFSNGVTTNPPSTASASKASSPHPSTTLTNGVSKKSADKSDGQLLSTKRSADHLDSASPGKKVKIDSTPDTNTGEEDSDEEAEFEDV